MRRWATDRLLSHRLGSGGVPVSERWDLLRRRWRLLLRLSIASGTAFFLARTVLGHQQAFFAPIAAVIMLIAASGVRRVRTLVELVAGVATGVLVGELLIVVIGRGPWQVALVVVLAVAVGTMLGLSLIHI